MISLIDTHAHIDLPVFDDDREAMLQRARTSGVHAVVVIGHTPSRWRTTATLCSAYPFVVRTVGMHPNDAEGWSDRVMQDLEREIESSDPVAIGETGLDFYRDSASADVQREAFAAQISLARRHDLPIVIHQRQAEDAVLDMLREHGPVRGVMHCFSGDAAFAESCVELGLMLGIGGVATYPKSDVIRAALAEVPLEVLLVETDAPYLAPQRWRGKRNEPSYVVSAAQTLASVRGMSLEEIAGQTSKNAVRLFGERLEDARVAGMETG